MINLFNYIDRPSPIHRLTGTSKLIYRKSKAKLDI